jgi:hypothetical protein
MANPTVNTLDAISSAHKLLVRGRELEKTDNAESTRLTNIAVAGFSATLPYLRQPVAEVQQKHFLAIKRLIDEADKHPDIEDEE